MPAHSISSSRILLYVFYWYDELMGPLRLASPFPGNRWAVCGRHIYKGMIGFVAPFPAHHFHGETAFAKHNQKIYGKIWRIAQEGFNLRSQEGDSVIFHTIFCGFALLWWSCVTGRFFLFLVLFYGGPSPQAHLRLHSFWDPRKRRRKKMQN